MGKRAFVVAR